MIYHLLRGNILHTTPSIAKGILKTAGTISRKTAGQHYLCIAMFGKKMLYNNVADNPYVRIFENYSFSNYRLFYNRHEYMRFILTRKKSDKFLIHGNMEMNFHIIANLLFLLLRKDLLRNTSLICWGNNDFLCGTKLKTKLSLGLVRQWTYNRYKNILTLSRGDYEQVKALYPKANVRYLPYWSSQKHVLDFSEKQVKAKEKTCVMVSHSGWPENNHLKSFSLLKKYVPNISVICPLCYGNAQYIEQVVTKGEEIFGVDFHYFKDLKPREEYDKLLKSIDVYVTGSQRQTGLAAIYGAMDGGAKVYVTGNLLDSFRKDGYSFFALEDIEKTDLEAFQSPIDIAIAQDNIDLFNKTHYDGVDFIEAWRSIYED